MMNAQVPRGPDNAGLYAEQQRTGAQRRTYEYRIVREIPPALGQSVRVTCVEVWERNAAGQLCYHNSRVTDLDVDVENVAVGSEVRRGSTFRVWVALSQTVRMDELAPM